MEIIMKQFAPFFILALIFMLNAQNSVLLENNIISLEAEGTAIIGNGITIEDAKVFAINDAKRNALEQVGTYLESNTTALNYVITKDEIKTFTGSVLKADVLRTENALLEGSFALKVKIKVTVDTGLLNKRIDEVRNDSQLKKMLENERKRVEELTKQIAELQKNQNSTRAESKRLIDKIGASEFYNKAYFASDTNEKLKNYSKAIELNPEYSDAYNNRGNIYFNALADYEKAARDYEKAIELDPKNAFAYNNRANVYVNTGNYKEAIRFCSKAIEIYPEYSLAFSLRGQAHYYLEEYDKAIADYSKSIGIDSSNPDTFSNRGVVFYIKGMYKEAIEDYDRAIKLSPLEASFYSNRGAANDKLKKFNEAVTDYNKAISLNSAKANYYLNRGNAYCNSSKYKESAADYNQYLKLNGNKDGNAEELRQMIKKMGFEPKY
jgi:tetratricopeptide (TPR) repeat protein